MTDVSPELYMSIRAKAIAAKNEKEVLPDVNDIGDGHSSMINTELGIRNVTLSPSNLPSNANKPDSIHSPKKKRRDNEPIKVDSGSDNSSDSELDYDHPSECDNDVGPCKMCCKIDACHSKDVTYLCSPGAVGRAWLKVPCIYCNVPLPPFELRHSYNFTQV